MIGAENGDRESIPHHDDSDSNQNAQFLRFSASSETLLPNLYRGLSLLITPSVSRREGRGSLGEAFFFPPSHLLSQSLSLSFSLSIFFRTPEISGFASLPPPEAEDGGRVCGRLFLTVCKSSFAIEGARAGEQTASLSISHSFW